MSPVPLVSANLATLCVEGYLYGIVTALFIFTLYLFVIRQWSKFEPPPFNVSMGAILRSVLSTPMSIAAILMFLTVTAHWIIDIQRGFHAFIIFQDPEGRNNPFLFYANVSEKMSVAKIGLSILALLIGDSMLIYRLWVVWNYAKSIIIFPVFSLFGLAVSGVAATYTLGQLTIDQDVFVSDQGRWVTSSCVCTLCTNVYCTSLISWRIWNVNARRYALPNARSRGSSLMSTMAIFVESAALYTFWTIIFFVSYQSKSNIQFPFLDLYAQITAIALLLINVRVNLGWAQKAQSLPTTSMSRGTGSIGPSTSTVVFPMHPLRVNVDVTTDVQKDDERGPFHKMEHEEVRGPSKQLVM